jgi:hypothetical protein
MVELTSDEYRVLKFRFYQYANPFQQHDIVGIVHRLMPVSMDARIILEDLVSKNVLSKSPDETSIRLTDYGHELYLHFENEQKDWYEQEIAKVDDTEKDEILIRQDQKYRGYWIIRQICLSAKKNITIQDNYVGPDLFQLLSEMSEAIEVSILISDKSYKGKEATQLAY